jgi:formate hydrogenlyase subunit 3/multisubunit Na+/H+ antiporter MnhD subunit
MAELAAWPLLSILLALPVAGALLTGLLRRAPWAQWIALGTAASTLCCALLIVAAFDRADPDFQLLDSADWVSGLNVRYLVGVDGLSLLFLPATALLFCGAIVAGWRVRAAASPLAPGLYFALLLLLEAATLGVFCALDSILFFFCWEFTLLPLYFLVSLWGLGAGRQAAAVRYFLVMLAGGVPLLFGLLALVFGQAAGGALVFDLPTLLATPLPESRQYLVFLLLLVGFGVKVPLVPLHTWLPSLAMGAPAAVTALLVGLKLGAYGLIRLAIRWRRSPRATCTGCSPVSAPWPSSTAASPRWHRATCAASWRTRAWRMSGWCCSAWPRSRFQRCRACCCNCSTSAWPPAAASWRCPFCSAAPLPPTSANSAACCAACRCCPVSSCCSAWPASACRGPAASPANC